MAIIPIGLIACGGSEDLQTEAESVLERVESAKMRANAGDSESAYQLGSLFEFGMESEELDISVDLEEAVKWYLQGARLGNSKAQASLGQLYATGKGVKENDKIALRWFRKAADQGNANAQNNVGLIYSQGSGVAKNYAEASAWFDKAIAQGHRGAINNLSWQLATCPLIEFRDGNLAVQMMEAMLADIQPTSTVVDTLAAAYAETGDYQRAIKTQTAAISLLEIEGSAEWLDDFNKRLGLYRDKKPWRD